MPSSSFTVAQILDWVGGRVVNAAELGDKLGGVRIEKPSQLVGSASTDVAFFFSRDFEADLPGARPGVLITGEPFVKPLEKAGLPWWKSTVVVACPDPYRAMGLLTEKFAGQLTVAHVPGSSAEARGPSFLGKISKLAEIHPSAKIGQGVSLGAGVVVEQGAQVGDRAVLYPGVFVGPDAVVGEDCVLFPHVVLYEQVQLGKRVRIHAGTVLGGDGFGYAPKKDSAASLPTGHQKIYHFGRVVVGDDVEIGALTAVDRGTFGDTVIEKNAKVDNLCQLGHNTRLEEGAVVCGGNSLAGGASVGKYALVLGICGLANRVHVGTGARVAAMTLVSKDVEPGTTVSGNPMREHKDSLRAQAALNRLAQGKGRSKE